MLKIITHKIIIAGIGAGESDLISLKALDALHNSDLILVPRSKINVQGIAERIILKYSPEKILTPLLFPMTLNESEREQIIFDQLENLLQVIKNSRVIYFPVIGDSVLYSTGKYLYDALKKLLPDIELEIIPGISAHSVACACAKKFLAMNDEIFTIIPATANDQKILNAIKNSDVTAIYKPSANENLYEMIEQLNQSINFKKIITVQKAGSPDEKIYYGLENIKLIKEYMTVVLLWR